MKQIYYLVKSSSFGDTLASTPTLRYLSKVHNSKINVITHNKNVFMNSPYVDKCLSFNEFNKNQNYVIYESFTYPGQKDGNGIEKKFSRIDTRQLHAMDLGFQLLPEEMSYDFYPNKFELDIKLPEKYVVLHITTNWPNRTWSNENWQSLIDWLNKNKIFTVLIGNGYREELHSSYSDKPLDKICPKFDNLYGIDLTNQGTISDMWWVLNGSDCLITMDSGPLHLAGCTNTNILQLGSAINPKLRAPYRNGSQDYKYHFVGGTCNIYCNSNLEYNVRVWGDINSVPPQPHCLENKPTFECHPTFNNVIDKLNDILNSGMEKENTQNLKSEKIKFGIYTSFYNSEKYINQCFENIERINYSNFEWHITDDFSSDKTKELLLNRLNKSKIKNKIIYYEQSEKKQMYWKPDLFFDSSFDWIVLIDSDDSVDSESLNVYNNIIQDRDDLALISSDGHKINESNNNLHSITYILNDEEISKKINRYHPTCDYLNNLSYSCFGLLRAFKLNKVPQFEIVNQLACAEDSYHVFWSNSYGKYLHIPRPLYKWTMRDDSESHSIGPKPGFNDNFEIALNKLKSSDYGVDMIFNDVYLETCSLGSYTIEGLKNKKVSLWTRNLTDLQKNNLKSLYHDCNLVFNDYNSEINIVCLNFFDKERLDYLMNEISKTNILLYYQNQKQHLESSEKDDELSNKLNYYKEILDKHISYSWWTYIRHFIIKN